MIVKQYQRSRNQGCSYSYRSAKAEALGEAPFWNRPVMAVLRLSLMLPLVPVCSPAPDTCSTAAEGRHSTYHQVGGSIGVHDHTAAFLQHFPHMPHGVSMVLRKRRRRLGCGCVWYSRGGCLLVGGEAGFTGTS